MWKKSIFSVPKPVQRLGLSGAKSCQNTLSVSSTLKEDDKQAGKSSPVLKRTQLVKNTAPGFSPARIDEKLQRNALSRIWEIIGNEKDKEKSSAKGSDGNVLFSLYSKIIAVSTALRWKKFLSDDEFPKPSKQKTPLSLLTVYRLLWPTVKPTNLLGILPVTSGHTEEVTTSSQSTEEEEEEEDDLSSTCSSLDSIFSTCASWTQNTLGVKFATLKENKKAVKLFQKACSSGLASAQFNMGLCYEKGQGVPQDLEKAVEYYSQAAKQKHAGAMYNLAGFYFSGVAGLPQSNDMGMALMEDAARLGLAQAQSYLGLHYADITSGERNLVKSYEYFLQAASQKDRESQYYVGICYEKGLGVARDMEEAFKWYSTAAQAGQVAATYNLGVFHEHGLGGLPVDKAKAMEYYRIAAEAGDADAMHNLQLLERSMSDDTETARQLFLALLSNWNFPEIIEPKSKPRLHITRNSSSPGCLGDLGQ